MTDRFFNGANCSDKLRGNRSRTQRNIRFASNASLFVRQKLFQKYDAGILTIDDSTNFEVTSSKYTVSYTMYMFLTMTLYISHFFIYMIENESDEFQVSCYEYHQ